MDAGTRDQFWKGQRGLRGPAWRSIAAQEMTNCDSLSAAQMWDPRTIKTAKYFALRTSAAGQKRAAAAYPTIDAAIMLHANAAKTDIVKLMILVDLPIGAIAERVGVEAEVVEVWEQLFFDVRPVRLALSWISRHVVDREHEAGNTMLAAQMKLALMAGVDGVNAMLAMDEGVPLDPAEKLFQRNIKLQLKFDEAAGLRTDSERGRTRFIKLYADLRLARQRLELAGKKLAARCGEARDRHELAKMRLESRQEVAAVKAKEKSHQSERRGRNKKERSDQMASEQELRQYADLAEQKAAACRVAESPLARLTWSTSKPKLAPEPITLFELEKQTEPILATADQECECETNDYPYDKSRPARMRDRQLVTQGGV